MAEESSLNQDHLEVWMDSVCEQLPTFVSTMKDSRFQGRYRYSYSGDLYSTYNSGLASTTFAVRVLYILDKLDAQITADTSCFIRTFQNDSGYISDKLVIDKSLFFRMKNILRGDLNYLTSKPTKIAETRQAVAALFNLGAINNYNAPFMNLNEEWISKFIASQNWSKPWSASSYVNHLLFFVFVTNQFNANEKLELVEFIFRKIGTYRNKNGFYYTGDSLAEEQNIGSMMKLMMGFSLFDYHHELLDENVLESILTSFVNEDACQSFNTFFVLSKFYDYYSSRSELIHETTLRKVFEWKSFYWSEYGGFSFRKGFSGSNYLGANISKGLAEPDMHGTAMFTWGLSIASKILGRGNRYFREPLL